MAQLVNVRLSRGDASPWGFRLQGGKDFGQPLLIQKVNGGSLAERAGLQVGDALIRVNNVEVHDMRHKDAQDTLVRAGNNIELTVQRGGMGTWKPSVTPVGQLGSPGAARSPQTVTKTSLAAKPSSQPIPSGHNVSPRPFGGTPQLNGGDVKAIVNKQYNSPVNIYSEENIAETLSAQAEVLAGGAIGVNFMKNEKTYDSQHSEVFKMVQEVEKEPREPEPELTPTLPATNFPSVTGLRHVAPPEAKPPTSPQTILPPGQNICADCERLIVGVFVRIKDKNLHVECFKCATCGSSLKNVGYYNVNNKLYCDIHAKMAAKQAPPAPNLEPVTIPPGGRIPTGTFSIPSIPSAPLAGPKSPQPGTIAPLPFHTSNTPGPKPFGSSIAPSTPTSVPFSVPSTPPAPSNFPKPEPSRVVWPPATQSPNVSQAPIDKKKQTKKNFDIPVVKCEDVDECKSGKRMSVCSEEVCQLSSKCTSVCQTQGRPISPVAEKLRGRSPTRKVTRNSQSIQMSEKYESNMGQQRIEIYSPVPRSPSAEYLDVSSKPHGLRPYQSAAIERPLSPAHVVVFPPQIPDVLPRSRSTTPQPRRTPQPKPERKAQRDRSLSPSQAVEHAPVKSEPFPKSRSPSPNPQMIQYQKVKSEKVEQKLQRKTSQENSCRALVEYRSLTPSPIPMEKEKPKSQKKPPEKTKEHLFTKEEVEKIVQEELKKLLQKPQEKKEEPVSCYDLPKPIIESGNMASALSVAPDRPFTPVPFPTPLELPSVVQQQIPQIKKEPVPLPPETAPYFPPEPPPPQKENLDDRTARACREVGVRSPMTEALTIAPDRAYSPLPHQVDAKSFKPIQGRKQSISMLSALTVAPTVPFTVPGMTPIPPPKCETPTVPKIQVKSEAPYVPHTDIKKQNEPVKKPEEPVKKEKFGVDRSLVYEGGKTKELIKSFESASSKCSNASYERKSEYLSEHTKSMHPPKGRKTPVITKPDPAGLLSPSKLPYYQQNIGEIPVRNRSISPVPHRICAPTIHPQSPLAIQESHKTMQKHHSSYSGKTNQGFVSGKEASLAQTEYKSEISKLASTTQDIKKEEARRLIGEKTAYGIRHPESLSHSQQNLCETPEMQSPVAFSSQKYMSQQQSKHLSQQNQQQGYFSKTYSESSTSSSKSMSKSVKTITTTTKTDKIIEDRQQLTPSPWKGTYVKAVQTLSPITVRLPSPQPPPLKPKGELSQQTSASVVVKPKPKGSSTMANSNGKTTTSQSYNQSQCSTGGKQGCGESKGCGEKKGCGVNKGCSEKQGCGESKGCGEKQGCGERKGCGEKQGCGERKGCGEKCNKTCSQNSVCCQTSETQCCEETSKIESQYQQRKVNGAVTVAPSNYQFTPQGNIWTPACMSNTSSTNVVSGSRSSAFTSVNKNQSVIQKTTGALGVRQTYPPPNPILNQTLPKTYTPTNPGFCVVDPSSSTPNAGGGGIGGGIGGGLGGGIGGLGGGLGGGIPGGLGGGRSGTAGSTAPKRGRGVLNAAVPAGGRIPLCGHCNNQIRGPFITALGKIWCPDHFTCSNAKCKRPLQDIGFVEEQDGLYCEFCFEQYLAPTCSKCNAKIKGDCLNAIGKHFHPQCFCCAYCDKLFGNNLFFLEDGLPYCENDWNELFTTKCIACGFPIEAGDRWVEALNNNYHSKCFNCTMCKKNLEGQSFFAKGGRPYCKTHAR